jgi:spore germination cell wall hydrolase CwlJ-like protein
MEFFSVTYIFSDFFNPLKEYKMDFEEIGHNLVNVTIAFAFAFVCALLAYEKITDYEKIQIAQEQQQEKQKQQQRQQTNIRKLADELHIKKLVDIIWCEDRTSIENAKDVLSTIVNRTKNKTSIKDLVATATKSYQFSCNNDPSIIATQRVTKTDIVMKSHIRSMVLQAISGRFVPTHYATHYYAYKKIKKPKWARHMAVVKINNNHVFLI